VMSEYQIFWLGKSYGAEQVGLGQSVRMLAAQAPGGGS